MDKKVEDAKAETQKEKRENVMLSKDEWNVMDDVATAAKMDWWFDEYETDGDIPPCGASRQDLEDLATALYDSDFVARVLEESVARKAMECFQRHGIQFETDYGHKGS